VILRTILMGKPERGCGPVDALRWRKVPSKAGSFRALKDRRVLGIDKAIGS
jgi:hypothetical protein